MAELTIDNYFLKIEEIKTLSTNPNTTLSQLNTLFIDLETLDTQLQTEMNGMVTFPNDFVHANKFILVQYERSNKSTIQVALLDLMKTREEHIDNVLEENKIAYSAETYNIENTAFNIMESCNCMTNRTKIVRNVKNKNI